MFLIYPLVCFILVVSCYSLIVVDEYYYISYRLVNLIFVSMYIWYLTATLTFILFISFTLYRLFL